MTLLFAFPEQMPLAHTLPAPLGEWTWRHFPDGESLVQVHTPVSGKDTAILCSLNQPDEKTLPLLFLARTLKDLGARKVTLIAPYLGYMRQDIRFHPGEAVTADLYADLLSPYLDALITIDPHLHRHPRLEDIYRCECTVLSATSLMAQWIVQHVAAPMIIGPDQESHQWVARIADEAKAPYAVLSKTRHSDHEVDIQLPEMATRQHVTPVIIDDIISTAGTMIKTVELLRDQGFSTIYCLATHALFAGEAYTHLQAAGVTRIVTADTLPHASNGMAIATLLTPHLG